LIAGGLIPALIVGILLPEGSDGAATSLALSVIGWHVYPEIRSSVRMRDNYSRVVVEALSTQLGLFYRIDKISTVVVWTTGVSGRAANVCSLTGLETM
jgi:hypothetical protein